MLSGKITVHEEPKKAVSYGYAGGSAYWDSDWQNAMGGSYQRQKSITEIYVMMEAQRKQAEKEGFVVNAIVRRKNSNNPDSRGIVKKFAETMSEAVDANDEVNVIMVAWEQAGEFSDYTIAYSPEELEVVK